jgi:hypothetical protein
MNAEAQVGDDCFSEGPLISRRLSFSQPKSSQGIQEETKRPEALSKLFKLWESIFYHVREESTIGSADAIN